MNRQEAIEAWNTRKPMDDIAELLKKKAKGSSQFLAYEDASEIVIGEKERKMQNNSLGEELRKIRRKRGLTQTQLSELCGINESIIDDYENGCGLPNDEETHKIGAALDIDLGFVKGFFEELELEEENTEAIRELLFKAEEIRFLDPDFIYISQKRLSSGEEVKYATIPISKANVEFIETWRKIYNYPIRINDGTSITYDEWKYDPEKEK